MNRLVRLFAAATALVLAAVFASFHTGSAGSDPSMPGNQVVAHAVEVALGQAQAAPHEQDLSEGVLHAALEGAGAIDQQANQHSGSLGVHGSPSSTGTQGCQNVFTSGNLVNIRVNQDCSLRRQAEEVIAINPTNEDNLVAGQNDSRIGFNHCGYDWSFDGGRTWGDQLPPFWQFQLLDGHTADACSDPTATFDANGNAYVGGVLFDITSAASAFVVMKSNAGIGGAFYHTPDSSLSFQTSRDLPLGVVANDNNPTIFHDKEFIVADANAGSPKKNNVYGTWTRFNVATGAGVGANSPIYFSQSTNGGATWSAGVEISGANAAICTVGSGSPNPAACDQDQGSHPTVGPDGTIYVTFGNGNTPGVGINQVLFVKCPAAADCTKAASWTGPVKVGALIGTHPQATGANVAGCPVGRRCLPPNGYRVPEFTSISNSVDAHGAIFVVWSDFRNGAAPCNTGVFATSSPPCDNDVFYAYSTNGGASFSATRNITPASQFGPSAQWQPWSAVSPTNGTLWAAYYDRSYGHCETDGCNDITLARITNPATATPSFAYTRLTTSSMPNLTTVTNPLQAGFLGDYMWVATDSKGRPHVVWGDTRGLNNTVEEDIYYARGG
jgi:hypothetical protein